MVKIYTLFQTETTQKQHPLSQHVAMYLSRKSIYNLSKMEDKMNDKKTDIKVTGPGSSSRI